MNKYLVYNGSVVTLFQDDRGLWIDDEGTVYALQDNSASVDPNDNCGVGLLSIPGTSAYCKPHDWMYSSPAFQLFHSRAEADDILQSLIEQSDKGALAWMTARLFRWISRRFGGRFWEREETR